MHKKLFTLVVWLTAITMLWVLPFGGLPTQAGRAAAPASSLPAVAPASQPPQVPPAPPLEAPASPLTALQELSQEEYLRLYRGQPAWPQPAAPDAFPAGLAASANLPTAGVTVKSDWSAEISSSLPPQAADERAALALSRRLEDERLHDQAQLPTALPSGNELLPGSTGAAQPAIPAPAFETLALPVSLNPADLPAPAALPDETNGTATIQGRVTSALDGSGLAGANVYVVDEWGGMLLTSTQTDADGYYSMEYYYAPSGCKIQFTPNSADTVHVGEWYQDQLWFESAMVLYLLDGQTLTVNAALEASGQISGHVTAAATGLPLEGVSAVVVNPNTLSGFIAAYTDASGAYTIYHVPAGQYYVRFSVSSSYGYNVAGEWYNNQPSAATANLVSVSAGAVTPGINAALEPGASISGQVTRTSDGAALEDIYVLCVTADTNETLGSAYTDASGNYTIDSLPAGNYKIYFQSWAEWVGNGEYVNEWYQDKADFATADPLTLAVGQHLTGINGVLAAFGSLSGTVTDAVTGAPIPGVQVSIFGNSYGWSATGISQPDGSYSITTIPPDSYRVQFWPPTDTFYLNQYYNGKTSSSTADLVLVTGDQAVTGINGALVKGGKIAGTITEASSGQLIPYAGIYAYNYSTGEIFTWASADQYGEYILEWMPAGTYKIYFTPDTSAQLDVVDEWYNNQHSLATADPVTVLVGAVTSGIDAALDSGASISGRVTRDTDGAPVAGIYVNCYNADTSAFAGSTTTDGEGNYTIPGLTAGRFLLFFQSSGDYSDEWYQDKTSWDTADPVEVAAVQDLTGIDAVLTMSGKITGTVTDAATHSPVPSIYVSVYDAVGIQLYSTYTDQYGNYTLGRLDSGQYKIFFQVSPWIAYPTNLASEWYNNQRSYDTADWVNVTQGQTTAGIHAALEAGATISGTVTRNADGEPLSGINIVCVTADTYNWVYATTSNYDGTYTIPSLPAGSYKLRFEGGQDYISEWYHDQLDWDQATHLAVDFGQVLDSIDAALAQAAKITGTVTNAATGSPVANINVRGYDAATGSQPAGAWTDSNGNYTLGGLPAGTYLVYFEPDPWTGYEFPVAAEWYNNERTQADADPISLGEGAAVSGIDAVLEAGASINGRVTRASDGAPLANVYVGCVTGDTHNWVTGANTNADGTYTLNNLTAGEYALYFSAPDYLQKWYLDGRSANEADLLTVDFGDALTGIDVALEKGGQISGRVTSEYNGAPLEGVEIMVADGSGYGYYAGTTNAEGMFTSPALAEGSYRIRYSPNWGPDFTAEHITEWYKNQPTENTADWVTVLTDQVTGGLDAALTRGGIISGVITDQETGLPIQNVEVEAYIPGWDSRYDYTDETGAYAVKGLPAGDAYVTIYTGSAPQYIPERYNDRPYTGQYDPVPVSLNQVTGGIDASLVKGVRLSGQVVSDADGLPLQDVYVRAYDRDGYSWTSAWTDSQGNWSTWGLPDGEYTLRYWVYVDSSWIPNRTRAHLSEYGSDAGLLQNGSLVMLKRLDGFDIVDLGVEGLELGSQVSGVVEAEGGAPLADVSVEACPLYFYNWSDCRTGTTADDGSYTLSGLYAGRYSLAFYTSDSPNETARLYANQRYDGLPWYTEGDELRLPAHTSLAHIDATLDAGGFIRGVVTADDTLAPLPSVEVDFYTGDGQFAGYAVTNLAGEYVSPALVPGVYKVQFYPYGQSGMYGWEWYNNQFSLDTAAPLSVTAGATLDDIDAALTQAGTAAGGWIEGQVTAPDTGLPVANTTVEAWPLDAPYYWGPMYSTQTDTQGDYNLLVTAGSYVLRFSPPAGQGLAYEWYDNRGAMSEASPVLVSGGSTFIANAALEYGGSIVGTISDASSGAPLPNARVYVLDADGLIFVSGRTDESGQYVTAPLPSGVFYLEFDAPGYQVEYYAGAASLADATPLTIQEVDLFDINAALARAAILAGRVSAVDVSEPVFSSLEVLNTNGDTYWTHNYGNLSARGEYSLELPAGDYRVYAMPETPYNQDYQAEYFDHVGTLAEALVLYLTEGGIKNQVNFGLDGSGGRISGKVTGPANEAVPEATLVIYNNDSVVAGYTTTDATGSFTSPLLLAGSYKLYIEPPFRGEGNTLMPEYYTDRYTWEGALPVTVLSGQTTKNINTQLTAGNYHFAIASDTQSEAFGFYHITVVLDTPTVWGTNLRLEFGGTATNGVDYIPFGQEVFIPPAQISATFRMDLLDDAIDELDETVELRLLPDYYGMPGSPTTLVLTLADDETPVVLPAPQISGVSPDQSRNHVPVELAITGLNFTAGSQVRLTGDAGPFYPPVTYIHSSELTALLPTGFTPGVYDLTVLNPDGQSATLSAAYQSLSPVETDLVGASYELWTSPTSVYEGATVQLGQVVSQVGGETTLSNVAVRFYLGDPAAGGALIGSGSVASLAPNSQASTLGIPWAAPAAGAYTLYAVLDPSNAVDEANETNNVISRSVQVLEMPAEDPDLAPPVVTSFAANGGSWSTSQASIHLAVSASDAAPGAVAKVKFIEYVYHEGLGLWQEGQASNWLTYLSGASYPWTLLPGAGARYLQAWVVDTAGNVSLLPQQTWINYIPAGASLLAGQSHYYLFELETGADLTVTVTPAWGDPDLYVWAPDFYIRPPWVSISASEPDWVGLDAPLDGMYVARVYGYSDTAYTLSYTTALLPRPLGLDAVTDIKTLLTEPGLEPEAEPSEQRSVEAPVEVVDEHPFSVFLPVVARP